jgi:hypothetical protein
MRPFGVFQEDSDPPISESLSIENALWAGTIIASGEALGDVLPAGEGKDSFCDQCNIHCRWCFPTALALQGIQLMS